jgi:predicted MFS family arabinose efflux permease
VGGGLVDAFGWRSVFWVNVPVAAVAIVCAGLFVPESRAPRARRLDPAGQVLMVVVLGSVVYAIIESAQLGWTSPLIAGLLAVAAAGVAGIAVYEPRRADPLLELRLLRSVPFTAAIVMALFALCGFGTFLFITTQYLQDVRGLQPVAAGLCLLPVGLPVLVISPLAGRVVGGRGPRLPLLVAGTALSAGGGVSLWLGPATPLPAVLAAYLLFGVFLGAVNPPITNSAISGMPRSMAGLAGSLASTGRQAGTTLGVAISGTIIGPSLARGGPAFTGAAHGAWWMVIALGAGIAALALVSTGRWASRTAARAAAVFERVDAPAADRGRGLSRPVVVVRGTGKDAAAGGR